jgi:hypothetical protein
MSQGEEQNKIEKAQILHEHYQDTYAITEKIWEQRNKFFIYFLIVVLIGNILTYFGAESSQLLTQYLKEKKIDITKLEVENNVEKASSERSNNERKKAIENQYVKDGKQVTEFTQTIKNTVVKNEANEEQTYKKTWPIVWLQTAIGVTIFYLVFNLFKRTAYVNGNYVYLELVEQEIVSNIGEKKNPSVFTREGGFYSDKTPFILLHGHWFFNSLLVALTIFYFVGLGRFNLDFGKLPFSEFIEKYDSTYVLIFYFQLLLGFCSIVYVLYFLISPSSSCLKKGDNACGWCKLILKINGLT